MREGHYTQRTEEALGEGLMADEKNTDASAPTRWGILDRLLKSPFLFTKDASGASQSRTIKGETRKVTVKNSVQTEIKRVQEVAEVHETSSSSEEQWELLRKYVNIRRNEFTQREYVVQKEDDIAVCDCAPPTECREDCLNSLTSVECTPGHCPCGNLCQNQKFQKCEYAKVQMVKTACRGWGLLADEDIKAGDFVIEYCGEVISDKVAQSRVHVYEEAGAKEKYIISLDGTEFLDATRKGSLARFINHSCEPNCITRKWTVVGEVRIGIFALRDIERGEELTYDYNFQWFGGTKVECRCGSPSCVGFLGAKSRGFQETMRLQDEELRGTAEAAAEDIVATDFQGTLSNQELLNRLYAMAVGIWSFKSLDAKPNSIQLVSELKHKQIRMKKAHPQKRIEKEKPQKDRCTPKEMTLRLKKSVTSAEKKATVKVPVKPIQAPPSQDEFLSQHRAAELGFPKIARGMLTTKRRAGTDDASGESEDLSVKNKRARMSAKNMVNQKMHALSLHRQMISEAASKEVAAAQEQEEQAAVGMKQLLDEIRGVMKNREKGDFDALPFDLTERWVAVTTKQLRTSFDFHYTVVRHLLAEPRSSLILQM